MMVMMLMSILFIIFAAIFFTAECSSYIVLDRNSTHTRFDGLGGLSGGGATSRLLIDYKEPQRSQILDYLFKPNFGASLQILKVEIGGDSQSTDGCEHSHMHSADDLDYKRGYEWWLMVEAKRRNPDIKLYGLSWAFPGWVGAGSGSPFTHPSLTAQYIVKWLIGARDVYGLHIDYIGIWNERSSNAAYVKRLRQFMDTAGFNTTEIVAKDGGEDICNQLASDADYANSVSVVGLHYPSDYTNYNSCHKLLKPLWASEESSSYDNLNGAACWARVVTSHWVLSGITSSIMWNLVGSYYHGTNWYASSLMTAVQPWSGHYDVMPVIWATAHVTQFTKIGWKYLPNGQGSGQLPHGGFYATFIDALNMNFTLTIAKIDHDHAQCTRPGLPNFSVASETVMFRLDDSMGDIQSLALWHSNFEDFENPTARIFQRERDVKVSKDRTFSIYVNVGDFITITTVRTGPTKGSHGSSPESSPMFPLPLYDDFKSYAPSSEAAYFTDQTGAFEIQKSLDDGVNVMRQMITAAPIGWTTNGRGPFSLLGMREWEDLSVSVDFRLPNVTGHVQPGACLFTRAEQSWGSSITLCIYGGSWMRWTISLDGPRTISGLPTHIFYKGNLTRNSIRSMNTKLKWHTMAFVITDGIISNAALDGEVFLKEGNVRDIDTGFAGIGVNSWFNVEYRNFLAQQAGSHWTPTSPCSPAQIGQELFVRNCTRNGLSTHDQEFELLSGWGLKHVKSGLCVTANLAVSGSHLHLQECDNFRIFSRDKVLKDSVGARQQFKHDYTNIRNRVVPIVLESYSSLFLTPGASSGSYVTMGSNGRASHWSFFPNTGQLRDQYIAPTTGGHYPLCLSTCNGPN